MAGIAGIVRPREGSAANKKILEKMLQVMTHRSGSVVEHYCDTERGVTLGATYIGGAREGDAPPFDSGEGWCHLVDGEFYPADSVSGIHGKLEEAGVTGVAPFIREIHGTFALASYDTNTGKLVLAVDKFGLKPLYYSILPEGLAFASEIKALLQVPGMSRDADTQALSDCLRFGFVLGNKTLFRSVNLIAPGSLYTFTQEGFRLEPQRYWAMDELFVEAGDSAPTVHMNDVVGVFGDAVSRRLGQLDRLGLSLSGGLDSRAILAAMGHRAEGLSTYTLGLSGCQDERLAAQLAEIAGTRHAFLELTHRDLEDFGSLAGTLIFHSDGLYHPHESTEKRALEYFAEIPFERVLRGHGGELAKASLAYPVQATRDLEASTSMGQILDFIHSRANLGIRDVDPNGLFSSAMKDALQAGAYESLRNVISEVRKSLQPVDYALYFYLHEWVRRQVVASLAIFRIHVEVRLPFLDEDFLAAMLALPLSQRYGGEVQTAIVNEYMPRLAMVPNSNTGAPLNAGEIRQFITEKVNSVLKRLGVKGFRHYTEFQKWQREQFRKSIERILFEPQTLSRGYVRPEGLRAVFARHVSGERNYAHLLGTLVGLELWFRQFVDN